MSNTVENQNMTELSVIFVTYNRSNLLIEAIMSLRQTLDKNGFSYEIIVADDCSSDEHQKKICEIQDIKIVHTNKNSGLGANVNNGLSHANGRLILQLQDDWLWNGADECLIASINFINENFDVGIVQLTKVGTDLPVSYRENNGYLFQVFQNDHVPWMRDCGIRPYSDQPHIKRKEFICDLGPYLEGTPMTYCENEFKHRVSNQSKWRVSMIEGGVCFKHLGAMQSFNPGGRRHPLVLFLHKFPAGKDLLDPLVRKIMGWIDNRCAKLLGR